MVSTWRDFNTPVNTSSLLEKIIQSTLQDGHLWDRHKGSVLERCRSYKGNKQRQGPTLGVCFTEVSVKRESTVHNYKITWTLQKKRIRIYYLSLHRWQSRGGGGHVLVPKMFLPMYLTLPVTSATSECTFSALRQLKNYLTSTMKQDCLNKLEQLPTVRCIVPTRLQTH